MQLPFPRSFCSSVPRLVVALVLAAVAPTTARATIYSANIQNFRPACHDLREDNIAVQSICGATYNISYARFTEFSSASAGPGGLGSASSTSLSISGVQPPATFGAAAGGFPTTAEISFMYVTVSGSGDVGVLTGLNLQLEGFLTAIQGWAEARIRVSVSYPSRGVSSCLFPFDPGPCTFTLPPPDVFNGSYRLDSNGTITASGLMAGFVPGFEHLIDTPSFRVERGELLNIGLSLTTLAACGAGSLIAAVNDYCTAGANFSNTFGFAQNGPVFDLPAGWTANSLDGSIVGNSLVAVPEPSTWALIAMPLLGMAAARRSSSPSDRR